MVANVYSNRVQRLAPGVERDKKVDIRFSANVPGPANEASVFVNAVSTEWEAASVDGLRDKIS